MPSTELFELTIAWDEAVYEPNADSVLLADGLEAKPGMACLDMCTGTGLAALVLAQQAGAAVATDVNPQACRIAHENALRNDLWLDVACMDLAAGLDAPFDVITVNPPYLPSRPDADEAPLSERAVDGGKDGAQIAKRALDEIGELLAPEGHAVMLASSLQPLDELEERAHENGLTWDPVTREDVGRFETLHRVEITRRKPPEGPPSGGSEPREEPP